MVYTVNYQCFATPPYEPPQTVSETDISSALYPALWLIWLYAFILAPYDHDRPVGVAVQCVAAPPPFPLASKIRCGCP